MNNVIKNPKIEVSTGISLNEKDYMNSLLSSLKELVKNYAVVLTEASNEILYKKYKEMFDVYADMQRCVFEAMFRRGWYKLEEAPKDKIIEKKNALNKEINSLNS